MVSIKKIAETILTWYEENGRNFLWRINPNTPYKIMVAEILLQRTTAKSVHKFYHNFIKKYPNLDKLDKAEKKDLEEILSNLGLLYKAKIFKKIAHTLKENEYEIPDTKDKLMELYGIGDYISSAILTFGFSKNTPIVDSNIRRFSSRFWKLKDEQQIKKKLIVLTKNDMKKVYFGLLDICWFYCRAPEPNCGDCPLKKCCPYP
ncbi:MAG: hypothetical protein GF311_12560 [Candidatus Lokiarchaeota archaeon]|nr:hypothetical protein [Candidatus Lokiarchaeota archaeon]